MVNIKLKLLQIIWVDEFVCLRKKMYSLKCGGDSKNKLKDTSKSQSKHIRFEVYKNV